MIRFLKKKILLQVKTKISPDEIVIKSLKVNNDELYIEGVIVNSGMEYRGSKVVQIKEKLMILCLGGPVTGCNKSSFIIKLPMDPSIKCIKLHSDEQSKTIWSIN